ncbi:hypothetical protein BGX23_006847 [Mortierella sp. AD031]|nr:hypothetical protein BGX23_006847 [Mortierella sp. AD031]
MTSSTPTAAATSTTSRADDDDDNISMASAFTTSAGAPSLSSSSPSSEESHDHDMESASTATAAATGNALARIASPFVHQTVHSTTARTWTNTRDVNLDLQIQLGTTTASKNSTTVVTPLLPSNKRQESDLTTPDIESTVLSMDIDKEQPLTNDHDKNNDGTTTTMMTTTITTTENGVMVVYNKAMATTTAAGATTAAASSESEEEDTAYPLVQNRMFDVPEIIRSIAEFLDKPSLAKCCRVSKFWSTHCTPLLWRHIVDKHWRFGRFCASIQSQSHYIRSIKCEDWTDYEEMLLCQFPRLKGIAFHGSKESMAIREKILAKVSNTLTSLVLSSVASDLSTDSTRAIQNLHQLTTLKIINVTLNHRLLADILRSCESLEFLSLSRVQLDDGHSGAHGTSIINSGEGSTGLLVQRRIQELVPTRIKYLAMKEVTLSPEYLAGMLRNCPNLLELSFARNESLVISTEMIRVMKETCPRLYAIDIGSCKMLERETFTPLFTTLTRMTILNLSGTRIGDEDLLVVGQKCRSIVRLDIQYCMLITSKGFHRFLSSCSSSLRHLEASGVTIEPESFDDQAWTCTNLEIMFVHIGLIGSYEPYIPSTAAAARVGELAAKEEQEEDGESKKRSLPSDVVVKAADPQGQGGLFSRMFASSGNAGSSAASTSTAAATEATTTVTGANNYQRPRTGASTSDSADINASSSTFSFNFTTKTSQGTEAGTGTGSTAGAGLSGQGEDVEMKHALHPIQDVSNVQYLGLMGCGPKLKRNTPCPLLPGFRSVKRLHVLELYQSFKKEDLEWLVDSLPELCRIDAEKYNVSDEILGWFHATYPHVRIYRQE